MIYLPQERVNVTVFPTLLAIFSSMYFEILKPKATERELLDPCVTSSCHVQSTPMTLRSSAQHSGQS